MNKSQTPVKPVHEPQKTDPEELPYVAKSALSDMIRKVENRARARTQILEKDIELLIKDFLKGYLIKHIKVHPDRPGPEEISFAVTTFCRDLNRQVADVDVERFIGSLSSKILEISDAEKTSG